LHVRLVELDHIDEGLELADLGVDGGPP